MNEQTVRYHVRRREFLNEDPAKPAWVIGIVQDTTGMPDEDDIWKYGTVMLDFADCYNRVSFQLDLSDPEQRHNSLRKINLIAEVVNAVRDAIEKEVKSHDARPHVQDETQAAAA